MTWDRTRDLLINSQLLLPLSYHGITSVASATIATAEVPEIIEETSAARATATPGAVTSGATCPTNQAIQQIQQNADDEESPHRLFPFVDEAWLRDLDSNQGPTG